MEIIVATTLLNHERPDLVLDAVRNMFPDWSPDDLPDRGVFPSDSSSVRLVSNVRSLDVMIEEARNHRILDTALDAMTLKSDGEITIFSLSRQAAAAGKCSFVVDHSGRDSVPRQPGDDLAMNDDGTSAEWIDTRRL